MRNRFGSVLIVSLLVMLTGCGSLEAIREGLGVSVPLPISDTAPARSYCAVAKPLYYAPGDEARAYALLAEWEAHGLPPQGPERVTAVANLRELLGDTDETINQARAWNAVGIEVCGWPPAPASPQ